MLKIEASDSGAFTLTPELIPPTVYLDYCVIVDLARNPSSGQEVQNILLGKGGTLYLSWVHLVELFGLGIGPTYHAIRSYLASFGRSFVLIDSHARAVIDREVDLRPGKQNPVLAEDFLRLLASNWDGRSELNVTTLLDIMASDQSILTKYQALHRAHKDKIKQVFDDARNRYRADLNWRRQIDNASYSYIPDTPPTEYICKQMTRECIITHEQFNASDGLDFEHCVVSLAYCDFVVLDRKWARRCGKIIIPPKAATVLSNIEVEVLVGKLGSWSKTQKTTGP